MLGRSYSPLLNVLGSILGLLREPTKGAGEGMKVGSILISGSFNLVEGDDEVEEDEVEDGDGI